MKSKTKILCISLLCVFSLLCVVSLFLLGRVGLTFNASDRTSVKFFNEEYTKFDSLSGNFIPFGADNSWYESDIGFNSRFGLSFLKNDDDKNFIYQNQILGTTIYKKDSYELPEFPPAESVDELILSNGANGEMISIKDRNDIETLVNFLSTFDVSDDHRNDSSIVFYAVSNDFGGVFELNGRGSIYEKENGAIGYGAILTGELPENIQDIIKSYLTQQ